MVKKTFTNAVITGKYKSVSVSLDYTYDHQKKVMRLESPHQEGIEFNCSLDKSRALTNAIKQAIELTKALQNDS